MRNRRSTANGVERTASQETASTKAIAITSPVSGDSTIAEPIVLRPCQMTAAQPAWAAAAPTSPPTRAWLLLDGMPSR